MDSKVLRDLIQGRLDFARKEVAGCEAAVRLLDDILETEEEIEEVKLVPIPRVTPFIHPLFEKETLNPRVKRKYTRRKKGAKHA